jgi:RluA family pseudouridine synthase
LATEITQRRILVEDTDLLAVDKPAGLVSHATVDPRRDHLVAALSRLLHARDGAVGHLRQHNRLDRDTSGIVLFSRTPALDPALGSMFAQRKVDKTYLAIVRRASSVTFPREATPLRAYLATDRDRQGRTHVVHSGGRAALTEVQALLETEELVLVQARPHSGRTHQIRVQLAHLGFPIVGDTLYGAPASDVKRMLLHAHRLELEHPRSGARLCIVAPPPRAFTSRLPQLRGR